MAKTNFSALDDDAKKYGHVIRGTKHAKRCSFRSSWVQLNAMIQRITELTKSERGTEAIVTLVPDMHGDGIVGDNELTGNEATLTAHQDKVEVDQLRNAVKNTGKMNDQKTVVNFREQARDQLAYWLSDRMDQMTFLQLAGLDFAQTNDGRVRPGQGKNDDNLSDLAFNTAGG